MRERALQIAVTLSLSFVLSACSIFGDEEDEELPADAHEELDRLEHQVDQIMAKAKVKAAAAAPFQKGRVRQTDTGASTDAGSSQPGCDICGKDPELWG